MLEEKNYIVDSEGWRLYAQSPTGFGSKPSENCHWLDAGGGLIIIVIFIIAGGGLTFFLEVDWPMTIISDISIFKVIKI